MSLLLGLLLPFAPIYQYYSPVQLYLKCVLKISYEQLINYQQYQSVECCQEKEHKESLVWNTGGFSLSIIPRLPVYYLKIQRLKYKETVILSADLYECETSSRPK